MERIADPVLTRLALSIEVVQDPEQDTLYPGRFAAWVEVETAPGSGRFARDDRLDPSGHPNNPKREAALRAKYTGLAGSILGKSGAEDFWLGRLIGSTAARAGASWDCSPWLPDFVRACGWLQRDAKTASHVALARQRLRPRQ
jgi:hypothetical protein